MVSLLKMKPVFFPLVFLLVACNQVKPVKPARSLAQPSYTAPAILNYDSCKKAIEQLKQKNRAGWHTLSLLNKERIFTNAVTETIIPAWNRYGMGL